MKQDETSTPPGVIEYGSFSSYCKGFILSLALVLAAFFLAYFKLLSGLFLAIAVSILGFLQAAFQLVLFLNLTKEPKPRWNILVFLFMISVVLILVVGSLWIMNHLNYNMMPS